MPDRENNLLTPLLDSQPGLVILALDRDYRYLAFNDNHRATMARIWNVDIEIGSNMLELIRLEEDRERARANFDRALSGDSFTLIEAYGDDAQGERRYYRDSYAPILREGEVVGLSVFLTDVTEEQRTATALHTLQRDLEQLAERRSFEMLHAQKLESLGVLAGGIAHDFNNILAVIMGATDLASLYLDQPDKLRVELDRIQRGATRAAELTNQMLSYAGRAERHPERVSLCELAEEMMELLGSTLAVSGIEASMDPTTPDVLADAGQVRQVVLNLLTNAIDGVADGGRIRLAVRRVVLEGRVHAQLEVEDDGMGMDDETLARIFDPFFTTKFRGRGLGLAAVQGIVAAHDGRLEVHSEPGEGSRFVVSIPALDEDDPAGPGDPQLEPTTVLPAHVLVVDDEVEVLTLCAELLRGAGAVVSMAADGVEALTVLEATPTIDVVLLDLTMPGPTPEENIAALGRLRPDVAVVVFSGFDEREVRTRLGDQIQGFVRKPFLRATLLEALSDAIE